MKDLLNRKNFFKSNSYLVSIVAVFFANMIYELMVIFFINVPVKSSLKSLTTNNFNLSNLDSIFFSKSLIISYLVDYPYHSILYIILSSILIFLSKDRIFWRDIGFSLPSRILLVSISLIFVLNNGFSHYNFFTNQLYLFDRIILIVSSFLLFFSPISLIIYLPLVFLFFASFDFPFNNLTFSDKNLALSTMIYSFCFIFFNTSIPVLIEKKKLEFYWFYGILIIVCCSYLSPFLGKIVISQNLFDWYKIENFALEFEVYLAQHRILDFFKYEVYDQIKYILINYQKPLLLIVFFLEGLGVFLFFNWKFSVLIILSFIGLNTSILFLSGIFFWKWIIVNSIFIIYIIIKKPEFNYKQGLLTILTCFFLAPNLNMFPNLSWYATPYNLFYDLKVVDVYDKEYYVNGNDMAPYDIHFTFEELEVFNKNQLPNSTFDPQLSKYLSNLSIEELIEEKDLKGKVMFNQQNLKILNLFLKEFFSNYNEGPKRHFLGIYPFSHIQVYREDPFEFKTKLKSVQFIAREVWFSKNGNSKIEKTHLISSIDI